MPAPETATTSPATAPAPSGTQYHLRSGDAHAVVTEVGDFADILRRRLFDSEPAAEVVRATAAQYDAVFADKGWSKNVWDTIGATWRDRWTDEVAAATRSIRC